MALIVCHLLSKGPAIGTASTVQKSEQLVQMLQFLLAVNECDVVKRMLASAVACHWAVYVADPRHGQEKLTTDVESTATAAIVCIEQSYAHVADIATVAKFKRINLVTCDRSDMARASIEFKTNDPIPGQLPVARAWGLPYIKSVHTSVSQSGVQVNTSALAVTAKLLRISQESQ